MLLTLPKVLADTPTAEGAADDWRFYLQALCSGLRLGESLRLSWTDVPGAIVLDFTGSVPRRSCGRPIQV